MREPRIAVLSLNPHAGDGGLIGSEEKEIIVPAIQAASAENTGFRTVCRRRLFRFGRLYEIRRRAGVYHDQGLIPFKALSCGGVNFTAGLPVVRTSPAHGVGFDIAGENRADESAMRDAIYRARRSAQPPPIRGDYGEPVAEIQTGQRRRRVGIRAAR